MTHSHNGRHMHKNQRGQTGSGSSASGLPLSAVPLKQYMSRTDTVTCGGTTHKAYGQTCTAQGEMNANLSLNENVEINSS